MKFKTNLTENSVPRLIIKLTLPMIIGMVGMFIFNLIDTYFIAKLGIKPLAAISFTFPVIMLQGAISMGLGLGASSVISKAIGQKDFDGVKRLTTDALLLSFSLVTVIVIIGIFTINPLFKILGAKGEILSLTEDYMFIWYLGVPFVTIPMVGNNAIRAAGNTIIPSMLMVTAITINLILDPLLIFGIGPFPEMSIKGAALATVISRSITFFVSLFVLNYHMHMITFHLESFKNFLKSCQKILFIAIPAALTHLLFPLSVGIITRIISAFGEEAVASFGVGSRIEMFVLSPLMALGAVLIPFSGQNFGAGKIERLKKGVNFSSLVSLSYGFSVFIILNIFQRPLAAIFNNNPKVIELTCLYLEIVSIGFGLFGVNRLAAAVFNAIHQPYKSAGVVILRLLIIQIPLVLLAAKFRGLKEIYIALAISFIISGIISFVWLKQNINKLKQNQLAN